MIAPDGWFLIIGCQRSGTTLVRLVLECHSQIQCCDERVAYRVIAGTHAAPDHPSAWLGMKVPCLTEQLANRSLWDPFVLPVTPNVHGGRPMVFVVRDVRDTLASMLTVRVQGRAWVDAYLTPLVRAKVRREAAFRRRYAADLAALSHARHPRLARASFYWRYKTDALFDYLDRGMAVLPIRYEDLTRETAPHVRRICEFLSVPWEPGLLCHPTFAHGELTADGLAVGDTDPRRAVDAASIGRWSHVFARDELDEILQVAGATQARLYPETAH